MLEPKPEVHREIIQRSQLVLVVLILTFVGLIARLFWIQCLNSEKYQKMAFSQHWKKKKIYANRGTIKDRHGHILAISELGFSCYCNPKVIKDPQATANALAPILKVDKNKLATRLSLKRRGFVWLKRQLNQEQAKKIKSLKISGIGFEKEPFRVYPHNKLAAHVLGFVGLDHHGLEGIEASFNRELSGTPGYKWSMVDGRLARFAIYTPETPRQEPVDGANVNLTIDLLLQSFMEKELDQVMEKHQGIMATATLISIKSGEILAMAARPAFDGNDYRAYQQKYWRNSVISNAYELGSIMKPLVIAAVLTENIAKLNTVVFCHNGAYRAHGRTLHDHHSYGNLTVEEIIIHSSNIGSAILGAKLGPHRLFQYLSNLGLGRKSRIYLPGESYGLLGPVKRWTPNAMMSIPMGHAVTVTSLQMAAAYAALLGDGIYRPPFIVREIKHTDGRKLGRYRTKNLKRIYPMSIVKKMRRLLRQVVVRGTAKRANIKGISIAGKTGTAQKIVDGRYSHSKHIGAFVGVAPADNPYYCCIITVDEPKGSYYGGVVAAPYVARILRQALFIRGGKL